MDNSPDSLAKLLNGEGANAMSPEDGVLEPPSEDEVVDDLMDAIKTGDRDRVKGAMRAHRTLMDNLPSEEDQVDEPADTEQ